MCGILTLCSVVYHYGMVLAFGLLFLVFSS